MYVNRSRLIASFRRQLGLKIDKSEYEIELNSDYGILFK
jgi:hypothetical protein